ncbi:hypothetical protein HW561_18630 [Rhodobacteraceae bacterium B1Z28]|uniref:Glycerophosphoryl diester phosphodiesterase family protein n=1 Tax=Ruegeria haliotis TaxID=2747601 RepID=A0ABX2PW90_9RHOB|nr:hypothetical protein [Ruegeria haliotis]NVO57817.1 hypothetical protein [Ruegeria haliotis]
MTDTVNPDLHVPFGVGAVISDTFSIFFRKIHLVILLGFIPALVDVIVNTYAVDTSFDIAPGAEFDGAGFASTLIVTLLVSLVATAITTAMVIQLSYDAKLGRPAQVGRYFATALSNLPAIVVLSFVVAILIMIGMLLLIIPGVWLYAVFAVLVPAIVIDRAGFGAMRRSANLTKNYRWPIVGTLFLIFLCIILVSAVVGFIFVALLGDFSVLQTATPTLGPWVLAETVLNAIAYGWASVAVAMIFARLKEIKEGVSVADLADVFK